MDINCAKCLLFIVTLVKCFLSNTVFCNTNLRNWSYHNISGWQTWFPQCNGLEQSPINIINDEVLTFNAQLFLKNYNTVLDADLTNNGKTVLLSSSLIRNLALSASGITKGNFTLEQVHFHWGDTVDSGSEHTIDGKGFAMEVHFVHLNLDKYSDIETAKNKTDGVLVLSVLVEASSQASFGGVWENITYSVADIVKPGSKTSIKRYMLQNLLPNNLHDFYFYRGSFTTPPCLQSVSWVVFREKLLIPYEYVEYFRALQTTVHKSSIRLSSNIRPVQLLYSREVLKTFHSSQKSNTDVFMDEKNVGGYKVITVVKFQTCQLPATLSLSVLIPSLGVNWKNTNLISDIISTQALDPQLTYGVALESHEHPRGEYKNTIHVMVKITDRPSKPVTVISHYFDKCAVDMCTRLKSGDDSTCIRQVTSFGEDLLLKLSLQDSCSDSYQLVVKSGNNVLLDTHITINKRVYMKKNSMAKNSLNHSSFDWYFLLHVDKTSDVNKAKLFVEISHLPAKILVIQGSFPASSSCHVTPHHVKLIAGIVIGVFILALVLLTLYLCHRRYRRQNGAKSTLMNEFEDNTIL